MDAPPFKPAAPWLDSRTGVKYVLASEYDALLRERDEARESVRLLREEERYWRYEVVTKRLCPVDHTKPHVSHDCVGMIDAVGQERDTLRAQVEELRADIKQAFAQVEHWRHREGCPWKLEPCECGLDDARAALRASEAKVGASCSNERACADHHRKYGELVHTSRPCPCACHRPVRSSNEPKKGDHP